MISERPPPLRQGLGPGVIGEAASGFAGGIFTLGFSIQAKCIGNMGP